MGSQPKSISVITVVLNDAAGLGKTIRSVQGDMENIPETSAGPSPDHTPLKVEHIVIDGGSTDGTLEVIQSCTDVIEYWVSEPDQGIYDAMNKGLRVATGEWVLFLNAGDTLVNPHVLEQLFSAEKKDADVIYGDSIVDYGDFSIYRKAGSPSELWKGMVCSHQSVLFRKEVIRDAGSGIRYSVVADHELVLRLYKSGITFEYLPIPISVNDTRGISNRKQVRSICQRYRMVKKSGELSGLRSCYYLYLWALAIIAECAYLVLTRKLVYFFIRMIHHRSLVSAS